MLYPPKTRTSLRESHGNGFCARLLRQHVGRPSNSQSGNPSRIAPSGPDDTFQIIRFSNTPRNWTSASGRDAENVRHGLRYLDSLNSEGGTMMVAGIKAALDFPHDPQRACGIISDDATSE